MGSLTRADAVSRASLIDVTAYEVDLDLDRGDRVFGSRVVIRFTCRTPGAATFLDVKPLALRRVLLNGRELDPSSLTGGRLALSDLGAHNAVVVEADMSYSRDGQGLHRSVDKADGNVYVYGHTFLDAAPRVFACFDQPDLKAPYDVRVTAPADWAVLGNGAASQLASSPGAWRLARTQPLATYFVTVCAGPYACIRSEHDGMPLGLHARESLRQPLERQAEQILTVTRQSFDYLHELFGIRYPFGEYHQVFVPEFNAGAMENPGCVTLRDQMLFRGAATRDEVLTRSDTIAHELAHMWFGNLVTMTWWDDLWLNESFAEYMAHRTLVDATEFTEAWTDVTVGRKVWGYAAERTPSTHPVAGSPAEDADAALQNFDGIAYAKGSATLRQLIAYIGDGPFIAGVRDHLSAHAFGNADLVDFMASMEQASGRDLRAWAQGWLRTAKLDTLRVDVLGGDHVESARALRTPPADRPANRPHSVDIAGYTAGVELWRAHVVVDADEVSVPELAGLQRPRLVVPNASDLTWATVELDDTTLAALPHELALVPDGLARAVVWVALVDGVSLGTIDPRQVLSVFAAAWPHETNESVINRVAAGVVGRMIPAFLSAGEQDAATRAVVTAATALLRAAPEGSTRSVSAARLVARWTDADDTVLAWLGGEDLPPGLDRDDDFRWQLVLNRSSRGLFSEKAIDSALARDSTLPGLLNALTAKASRPDADAKEWAWGQLTEGEERSNYEMVALAQGFWDPLRADLVDPYVERFFVDVPAMAGRVGEDALARVAAWAYPRFSVCQRTLDLTAGSLQRDDLTPAVRRAIVDAGAQLEEAVRSQARYGGR